MRTMLRLRRLSLLLSLASSASVDASAGYVSNKTAFVLSATGATTPTTPATRSFSVTEGQSSGNPPLAATTKSSSSDPSPVMTYDKEYPGTAVQRMMAVRARVAELTENDLNGQWEDVRRKILWAGGLRDLPDAYPGQGYTGHSFNDYNHVDLTCMAEKVSDNQNDGSVQEIAVGNLLGPGIRIASLPELGPGGSWSTCGNGSNQEPPQDVAHIQFRSRIAFKLVWVPTLDYSTFVLVDDDGTELARGTPQGNLPHIRHRQMNYAMVRGGKYATVAETIAAAAAATTM